MKIFSSLLFFLLICICSCRKNAGTQAVTTKTDLITSAPWVYARAGLDYNKDGVIDQDLPAGTIPNCQLDNVLTFKKDNTGVADEGATKCNATDPQTTPFTWSFADSETNLNVSGNAATLVNGKFKIAALTKTDFSLSKDTVVLTQNMAIVVNLKH